VLHAFLPLSSFQHHLASFDSTFMHVFERFLNLGFFECQEALLVHWKVSLPISSGGVGLIFCKDHCANNFKSWMLIMLVIAFKLLLDLHPFLLEAIGVTI